MAEEGKAEKSEVSNKKMADITSKLRKNPWIISTIIFGVVAIVLLIMMLNPGVTGNVVSSSQIGQQLLSFYTAQGVSGLQVQSVNELSGVYEVNFLYQNSTVPIFVTKDGKYAGSLSPLTAPSSSSSSSSSSTQQAAIPKSDVPTAQAFVFAYCPYGLQFEKALLPVYNILKSNANISIVFIGVMHGAFEKVEELRQISIEQLYGNDKLFAYLNQFDNSADIGSCNGDATCLAKYLPAIYTSLGMDQAKIETYMNSTQAEQIYEQQSAEAASLGISGFEHLL